MAIEGIWTAEVYGPFGWENHDVFVLEDGRMIGGDNRQYTTGTYNLTGDGIAAHLLVYYYGPPRTVFGEKEERFETNMTGKLTDGVINGVIVRHDKPQFDLKMRLTKRMNLPNS